MTNPSERIHSLDAMRAVLMTLGILVHSAQVYNPDMSWLIYSSSNHWSMKILIDVIHAFRMPAFFLVSGYFMLLLLRRQDTTSYLVVRLKRILIPLVASLVTLNVAQFYFLEAQNWLGPMTAQERIGIFTSHLWFLEYLIIYLLIGVSFYCLIQRAAGFRLHFVISNIALFSPGAFVLAVPLISIGVQVLPYLGIDIYQQYLGVISIQRLINYLPFFGIGALLCIHPQALSIWQRYPISRSLMWISVFFIAKFFLANKPSDSLVFSSLEYYANTLVVLPCVLIAMNLFHRFFSRKNTIMQCISQASYTIYLFHHILVIGFGVLLMEIDLHPLVEYLGLVTVVLALSLVLHHWIIQRSILLGFLFNGRRIPANKLERSNHEILENEGPRLKVL